MKSLQKLKLHLNTIEKAKQFVNIASKYEENMDIVRDTYIVDAKSIMGLFSMDLSKPVMLYIYSDKKEIADAFTEFVIAA